MITKPIKEFVLEDVKNLISGETPESRVLDYKNGSPLANDQDLDQDKIELARDVTSFANTSGGHLIYGMEEKGGIPIVSNGFNIENEEDFRNRLDQILQAKIEPRLYGIEYQSVKLENGKYIFIIQIPKSWNGPHAVKMKSGYSFYGRHASCKYPFDVSHIRNAFNLHSSLITRIKSFRESQINNIYYNEAALPLHNNAKIVLHIMPISSFSDIKMHDLEFFYNDYLDYLPPIKNITGMTRRRNLDGLLVFTYKDKDSHPGYVQIHRNGIIEAVDSLILSQQNNLLQAQGVNRSLIPSQAYETSVVSALNKYMLAIKRLNINPPIFVGLSLIGVKGYYMGTEINGFTDTHPIDRDILFLPEEEINNLDEAAHKILKPSFDLVWNACGLPQSTTVFD